MESTQCSHVHSHGDIKSQQDVDSAIARIREICISRGARLTDLRLQVLKLVWRHKKPLGAYALIDLLANESTRHIAPPTVYRALEFLLEQGFIHRIKSLSAFVGCSSSPHEQQSHFLVCRSCGEVIELHQPLISQKIFAAALEASFVVEAQSLEVMGVCKNCAM